MSEHILKILLSELKTVRVRCKACGVVTEVPLNKLSTVTRCPTCPAVMHDAQTGTSLFHPLAYAMQEITKKNGPVDQVAEVEFVLPDPDPAKP